MDTTARVEAKKTELLETFAGLSEKQMKVASDLIAQAAFMAVTLEDLSASISENGTVEEYTNGKNQSGRKISSDAKLYASLIAKYTQIVTKLLKIVPKEQKKSPLVEMRIKKDAEEKARREAEEAWRNREKDFLLAVQQGLLKQDDYRAFMAGEIDLFD